ncbi:MAG: polyamine aminopropyltransferase [Proteobacteria bacterium]|nr:polyamine aminopropyltransferase [Pseudomonadota bacterium]
MALWYDEVYNGSLRFGAKTIRTLFVGESPYQKVSVFETEALGKALMIDDLWMCAEGDEKTYHEMIAHTAMTTAKKSERVLIIGGGDGGTAREVLSYAHVKHVDMVEIDGMVVEACQKYLPEIGTAWDDPRLNVVIGDGIAWVNRQDLDPYDVILVDGSDPVGPAVGLFNLDFYKACNDRLSADGILVTQAESPRLFQDVHVALIKTLEEVFPVVSPYYQTIMIYAGGLWAWVYATKGTKHTEINDALMTFAEQRTEHYNRDIHLGAFATPNYIKRLLKA